ncbi:SufD family Fe-S cluster assembly protein [Patescibacteria group bacterium]|nr:SufD family Fe-S cluster assembly protein [Patescibacteria group bacterium]
MSKIIELNSKEHNITLSEETDIIVVEKDIANMPAERIFTLAAHMKAQYVLILPNLVAVETFSRRWRLGEGAQLELYYLFLDYTKTVELNHNLATRAQINSHSLYLGRDKENLSVRADYNFNDEGSGGRVAVDALLNNQAQLRYDANINVAKLAQRSDTRVDMRLRLMSRDSRGQLVPGLNIAANDVKAGHSASTFQLSDEDTFYLRSRGLSPDEIQKMFALSMANKFVHDLADDDLKKELLNIISSRL